MKNKKFFDAQQASQYLKHCIIRVAGDPVYIHEVSGPARRGEAYTLTYNKIRSMGNLPKNISSSDEDVDMNPVPLGMVPYYSGESYVTFFASRFPARKWKIGLSQDNFALAHLLGYPAESSYRRIIFPTNILAETIEGNFLNPLECQKKLAQGGGSLPFSRRFAINHEHGLFYKDAPEQVGIMKKEAFELFDPFKYLKEALEEDVNAHH